MSTKNQPRALLLGLAVASIVAGGLIIVLNSSDKADEPHQGGEMAAGFGSDNQKAQLWQRLSQYRESHLDGWDGAFKRANPHAKTVLDAVKQVAEKVSGPSGFWHDKVPNEILTCHVNVDDPLCKGLEDQLAEFSEWDTVLGRLDRVDASRADVFLARNYDTLVKYLDVMVPADTTEAAMRQTTFYTNHLQKLVAHE